MQPSSMIDSAKGWHTMQLAVLGFIGFCGVLRMGEPWTGPDWLAWWSTGLAVLAFITALVSLWMVGGVAFPLYSDGSDNAGAPPPANFANAPASFGAPAGTGVGAVPQLPPNAGERLRNGIRMTFAAIIMMVLSAMGGWWPTTEEANQVEVTDTRGVSACGTWVEGAPTGSMWLETPEGVLTVALRQMSDVRPVSSC